VVLGFLKGECSTALTAVSPAFRGIVRTEKSLRVFGTTGRGTSVLD
jgi:hypothetical protein